MKLDQCIFLSLILCAAIILGSTTCVAVNFPYIKQQADKVHAGTTVAQQSQSDKPHSTTADTVSSSFPNNAQTKLADNHTGSTDVMVMTSTEKAQLINMLATLGLKQESDMFAFIKEFQSKHSLTPTGNIDSKTLSYIMEEVKLQKVAQLST